MRAGIQGEDRHLLAVLERGGARHAVTVRPSVHANFGATLTVPGVLVSALGGLGVPRSVDRQLLGDRAGHGHAAVDAMLV